MPGKKIKRLFVFLLIVGVAGAVFYFPFNFNDRYTCLYHRIVCQEQPLTKVISHSMKHTGHGNMQTEKTTGQMHAGNTLVPYYIRHFAFAWWGSLLLTGSMIFFIKKRHKNIKNEMPADIK